MTTYNLKSTVITNRDATPKVLTDPHVSGGAVKQSEGFVTTYGSADGVGSIYRLAQVPSNARVSSVKLQAEALGSAAALHVGVYYPTFIPVGSGLSAASASAVINTTLFASAQACSNALAETEIIAQSGVNTIDKQEQCLWQAAGLTADPGLDLDICAYVSAAVAAQGKIGLKVSYVS